MNERAKTTSVVLVNEIASAVLGRREPGQAITLRIEGPPVTGESPAYFEDCWTIRFICANGIEVSRRISNLDELILSEPPMQRFLLEIRQELEAVDDPK